MSRRLTDDERAARALTERQFQKAYVAAARSVGFLMGHHYDSRFSDPGTEGLPDLTVVGHGWHWFDELKRELGTVHDDQEHWHRELRAAGVEVGVWRPSQWNQLMDRLEERSMKLIPEDVRAFPTPARPRKRRTPRPVKK